MTKNILSFFSSNLLMIQILGEELVSGSMEWHSLGIIWLSYTCLWLYWYSQSYMITFRDCPNVNPDQKKSNHYHIIPWIWSNLTLEDLLFWVIPWESFTSLFSYCINLVFCCWFYKKLFLYMFCFFRIVLFGLCIPRALLLTNMHGNMVIKTETSD